MLMLISTLLMLDTSRTEIHMQYLFFMENIEECGTLSWDSAVLGYLYRQLCAATSSRRNRIGGCLHLLQVHTINNSCSLVPYSSSNSSNFVIY